MPGPVRELREDADPVVRDDHDLDDQVLACAFEPGDAARKVVSLDPNLFPRESDRDLLAAMLSVHSPGQPIDPIALRYARPAATNQIASLIGSVSSTAFLDAHIRVLRDRARRR